MYWIMAVAAATAGLLRCNVPGHTRCAHRCCSQGGYGLAAVFGLVYFEGGSVAQHFGDEQLMCSRLDFVCLALHAVLALRTAQHGCFLYPVHSSARHRLFACKMGLPAGALLAAQLAQLMQCCWPRCAAGRWMQKISATARHIYSIGYPQAAAVV